MTVRKKKTQEQKIEGIAASLRLEKAKKKDMDRAKRDRQIYIHGAALLARAAAGNKVSQAEMDTTLAGLVRKQDRLAFDLEPLPEPRPDDNQPVNPPQSPDLTAAKLRLDRAVDVFNVDVKSPPGPQSARLRSDLIEAIVGFEKLSGEVWDGLKDPKGREAFGFTDRPGELAKAS
jgi:hypothetical protein